MVTVFLFACFLCSCLGLNTKTYIEMDEWKVEDYELPQEITGFHSASIIVKDYMYLFGGLILDPFQSIRYVARRDLYRPDSEWEIIANLTLEDGFDLPWFTSTKGAQILSSYPDDIFLSCEDSANGYIWKFSTKTFTFTMITTMPIPTEDGCAVGVGDRIIVFGGSIDLGEKGYNVTQIYDYNKNEWSFGEEIPLTNPNGIKLHVCENINDQFIYLFAGADGSVLIPNMNSYKYDINKDEWSIIYNVFDDIDEYSANGVYFIGANHIPQTPYLLITGGETFGATIDIDRYFLNTVRLYNTETDEIEREYKDCPKGFKVPQMNEPRGAAAYAISTQKEDDRKTLVKLYAIGGRTQEEEPIFSRTTEVLLINVDTFSYMAQMKQFCIDLIMNNLFWIIIMINFVIFYQIRVWRVWQTKDSSVSIKNVDDITITLKN